MKAVIYIDVPEYQIGQPVSVHFKDTMCVKGVCEAKELEAIEIINEQAEDIRATIDDFFASGRYTFDKLND